MVSIDLPENVRQKRLASGIGYYWQVAPKWIREGWPYEKSVPLGRNLSQSELNRKAARENEKLQEWKSALLTGRPVRTITERYGTVGWMLKQYLKEDAFLNKVSPDNRADYHNLFAIIMDMETTERACDKFPTVGSLPLSSISAQAAYKLYKRMIEGEKYRRGEKTKTYMSAAWKRMRVLYPDAFAGAHENPWQHMSLVKRQKLVKPYVTREQVYRFAWGAVDQGRPELAAAAIICFEWCVRPTRVVKGYVTWGHYRPADRPHEILAENHKSGTRVWQILDEVDAHGNVVGLLYPEAEAVLAALPKRGPAMVLGPDGQVYKPSRFAQLVRRSANLSGLPDYFTLDACRHGGITEIGNAEIDEDNEMLLTGHKTKSVLRGYKKVTQRRVLLATKARRALVISERKKNAGGNG